MGLRRLRGRLDQVQGNANETMAVAKDLLADFQDGFGVKLVIDTARIRPLLKELLSGDGVDLLELPVTIKIDPRIDS